MKDSTMSISVTFSKKRISDMLVSAFEGGSNYWCTIVNTRRPRERCLGAETAYPHAWWPLMEGGSLTCVADIGEPLAPEHSGDKLLNLRTIELGLKAMSETAPRHFGDWLSERDDATTADVFLQFCLFGEVVFG